jgi:glycogen debranching enzyme
LWILALCDYCQSSGELDFQWDRLKRACAFFQKTDVDGDGLSETDRGSAFDPFLHFTTWMDSIERSGKAIEIQVLWGEALKEAGKLTGDEALSKRGEKILEKTASVFWKPEWNYFLDCVGGPSQNIKSSNVLFGLALADWSLPAEKSLACFRALESDEFTVHWGVSTASKSNYNFSGDGYHTGAVWNFTTALASLAEFRAGRPEEGMRYLKILQGNFGKRCVDSLDELFDSAGNPQGAVNQAWSVCLLPRILDDGMLGISASAKDKILRVSPHLPKRIERFERKSLRFNGEVGDIIVEREPGGKTWLEVSGIEKNKIVFLPPEGSKWVWIGQKELAPNQPVFLKSSEKVRWA